MLRRLGARAEVRFGCVQWWRRALLGWRGSQSKLQLNAELSRSTLQGYIETPRKYYVKSCIF
jgi:hypothetical protein